MTKFYDDDFYADQNDYDLPLSPEHERYRWEAEQEHFDDMQNDDYDDDELDPPF